MAECSVPKLSDQHVTGRYAGYAIRWARARVLISAPSITGKLLLFLESYLWNENRNAYIVDIFGRQK